MNIAYLATSCLTMLFLQSCGLYVPQKSLTRIDSPEEANAQVPPQAKYEDEIVKHIRCELATGLLKAQSNWETPWLPKWGVAVTIIITAQDQSGLNPTLSLIDVLPNSVKNLGGTVVTTGRNATLGLGAAASANATRSETIQFTYLNSDLLYLALKYKTSNPPFDCSQYQQGLSIESNLRLSDFIYDKLYVAKQGNGSGRYPENWPIYNTMTEEIIFLTSFGGNINPSYKFASSTLGSAGTLFAAQRTYTNDVIITFGTVGKYPSSEQAAQLGPSAQFQHNAKVQASAIATAIRGQSQ